MKAKPKSMAQLEKVAETIKLILETSWPFDQHSKITVETSTCFGGLPDDVTKRLGKDHGEWPIATAVASYYSSHVISIESLQKIKDKVEALTDYELQWISMRKPGELEIEFSNYKETTVK